MNSQLIFMAYANKSAFFLMGKSKIKYRLILRKFATSSWIILLL